MPHTLYFIPGVATDSSVFAALELQQYDRVYLEWERPKRGETISDYAKRFAQQIDPADNPILVGYSFGGIMAIEISKHIPIAAIILVSSIKHYMERPVAMLLTSTFSLNRIMPARLGRNFRFAYTWLNDPQNAAERIFIDQMARKMDSQHTDWAISNALSWRHHHPVKHLYHIHGDADRIFPVRYIHGPFIRIRGGSHLMLLNKGPEISRHIHRIVQSLPQPSPVPQPQETIPTP